MRVIVNCSGGASHSMLLQQNTTVQDVKELVADKEGTPVSQQVLQFAGRHLQPDSALLIDELQLDTYSLAQEVIVYMQPQLAQPVRVYLCGQPGSASNRMHPEIVEAESTLLNIQALLQQRQLTSMPFPAVAQQPNCNNTSSGSGGSSGTSSPPSAVSAQAPGTSGSSNVVVKRQDGCCCSKVSVDEGCSIQALVEAIWEVEGKSVSTLSCYQARDGCLTVMYG